MEIANVTTEVTETAAMTGIGIPELIVAILIVIGFIIGIMKVGRALKAVFAIGIAAFAVAVALGLLPNVIDVMGIPVDTTAITKPMSTGRMISIGLSALSIVGALIGTAITLLRKSARIAGRVGHAAAKGAGKAVNATINAIENSNAPRNTQNFNARPQAPSYRNDPNDWQQYSQPQQRPQQPYGQQQASNSWSNQRSQQFRNR